MAAGVGFGPTGRAVTRPPAYKAAALERQKADLEAEIEHLRARLQRVIAAIEALTAGDLFYQLSDGQRRRLKPDGTLKQMVYTVFLRQTRP